MSQDNDHVVHLTLTRMIHSHKSPLVPLPKGVGCPVSSAKRCTTARESSNCQQQLAFLFLKFSQLGSNFCKRRCWAQWEITSYCAQVWLVSQSVFPLPGALTSSPLNGQEFSWTAPHPQMLLILAAILKYNFYSKITAYIISFKEAKKSLSLKPTF